MKYINSYKLNEILKENENNNTTYDDLEINYNYELSDGINKVSQNSKQKAYGVKIDDVDFIITIDTYNDSSYPFMLTERDSPTVTVLKSEKAVHSVVKEEERVNKIISEKLKDNKKPFGNYDRLNEEFIAKIKKDKKNHMKYFNKSVTSRLKDIEIAKNTGSFSALVSLKESKISEMVNEFSNTFNKTYSVFKEAYDTNIKKESNENMKAILLERTRRNEQIAEEKRKAAEEVDLKNNTKLIEMFGYYPSIAIDTQKQELTFTAFNSKNEEEFKVTLPLIENEVDFFSPDYEKDDYFQYFILDTNGINNISKKDQERYYHTLAVIEDSFLYSKEDEFQMGYIAEHGIDPLGNKDESLKIEGKFELSNLMVNNYNQPTYLEYVNDEIKEKFKKSKNKIKP